MTQQFWNDSVSEDVGPYKVLLKRGEFIDPTRENEDGSTRVVPFKLYHPAIETAPQAMPTIIWSHGFGGNRDGAAFLSRYIASYGYNILHITHHGTDSSLWEGKPGHPWDNLRKARVNRHTTLNRMYDVPFAIDAFQQWLDENPDIGQIIDLENLGMSGHSFGALTTQVMAGQLIPNKELELISIKEPRFKAGILYSVVPVSHMMEEENTIKAYNAITLPLLHMTGTDDASPLEEFGYEQRLKVYDNTIAAPKHLLIKKDGDHMVYNGTRGKLGENPLRERHENLIKLTSLAYWDYYLKKDKTAQQWLEGQGIQTYIGSDAEFKFG